MKIENEVADLIKKNIADITDTVIKNLKEDDNNTLIAAYSGLCSVQAYFEYHLRDIGISNDAINVAKNGADEYVLKIIAEELNLMPQKKGNA